MRKLLLLALALLPLFPAGAIQPAPPKRAFHREFLANLKDVEGKLEQLAEAVPTEKYSWRPAEGVRSISEVYTHIAGSNYFLVTFLGKPAPVDMPKDIEKITEKAKVLAELSRSFDHVRAAATTASDADLEKAVNMFGTNTTQRAVLVTILNHLHEHLGQSIAYARMNGVAPPWSKE